MRSDPALRLPLGRWHGPSFPRKRESAPDSHPHSRSKTRTRILASLAWLLACAIAHAAPFNVTSADDVPDANPGDGVCETALGNHVCTLRAAIQEANATPGFDTINLQGNTTYLLTRAGDDDTSLNGSLDIRDSVDIVGAGAASSIIDGNGDLTGDRVFQVLPCIGGSCALGNVVASMSGITIRHGHHHSASLGAPSFGGGIFAPSVTIGGQLHGSTLTLTDCVIDDNSADNAGGAVFSSGQFTLINSIVANNNGGGFGGGIAVQDGLSLALVNSTITGNSAGDGGGVELYITGGANIANSTISDNHARRGGGIYVVDAGDLSLNIVNTTISGNDSTDEGGGFYAQGGTANLFNVTIAANQSNVDKSSSGGLGGGVYNGSGAALNFTNSIIADNYRFGGSFLFANDWSGTLNSQGYNIVSHLNCTVNGTAPSVAEPLLGPLQDNGGPTQTHALLGGSPAIDAGNPSGCRDVLGAILTTDQRKLPRPIGTACDIGAYEVQDLIYRNGFEVDAQ